MWGGVVEKNKNMWGRVGEVFPSALLRISNGIALRHLDSIIHAYICAGGIHILNRDPVEVDGWYTQVCAHLVPCLAYQLR